MTETSMVLLGVAAIAALPSTLATVLSRLSQKKDAEKIVAKVAEGNETAVIIANKVAAVHAIADGRLTEATNKIASLEMAVNKERTEATIQEAVQKAVLAAFKKNGEAHH